jgi:hypothetical protein
LHIGGSDYSNSLGVILCIVLRAVIISLLFGHSVIVNPRSTAKHQAIRILRPHSIDDAKYLQASALGFCLAWRFLVWNSEARQHLLQETQLFPIDLMPTSSTTFPWNSRPIEYKHQLDIQGQEAADAVEHVFFNPLIRWLIGRCVR